jgi:hypothetical protein
MLYAYVCFSLKNGFSENEKLFLTFRSKTANLMPYSNLCLNILFNLTLPFALLY